MLYLLRPNYNKRLRPDSCKRRRPGRFRTYKHANFGENIATSISSTIWKSVQPTSLEVDCITLALLSTSLTHPGIFDVYRSLPQSFSKQIAVIATFQREAVLCIPDSVANHSKEVVIIARSSDITQKGA